MSGLRVALVELYGVGGTADYTDCLAQALAEGGHEVLLITSTLFQPLRAHPAVHVTPVFAYRTSDAKMLKAARLARSLAHADAVLRAFQPDVVHAQGTVMPAVERRFYNGVRAPLVCTVHDVLGHEWRPWLGSSRRLYSRFDALICHSHASRRRLLELLPFASITVIPHGRYTPLAVQVAERPAARALLQLPEDARVALLFGFIRRYKGLDLFLDALREAHRDSASVIGLVAGRPLYPVDDARRRAAQEDVPVRWELRYIPRAEMPVHFAAADVVVLPYVTTSDSGLIELAAAFRKPVIATDTGGLAEAFARYGLGAVVPPNDPTAMARALLADYDGDAASAGVPWSEVASRAEELYLHVIGPSRAHRLRRGAA